MARLIVMLLEHLEELADQLGEDHPSVVDMRESLPLGDLDAARTGTHHREPMDTELAAALSVTDVIGEQTRRVLDYLLTQPEGRCDARGARETGMLHHSYMARRDWLVRKHYVVDSGRRELTGNGKRGAMWMVSPRVKR